MHINCTLSIQLHFITATGGVLNIMVTTTASDEERGQKIATPMMPLVAY
jgi:hypothetical protein